MHNNVLCKDLTDACVGHDYLVMSWLPNFDTHVQTYNVFYAAPRRWRMTTNCQRCHRLKHNNTKIGSHNVLSTVTFCNVKPLSHWSHLPSENFAGWMPQDLTDDLSRFGLMPSGRPWVNHSRWSSLHFRLFHWYTLECIANVWCVKRMSHGWF